MVDENIYFKNRLSQILKDSFREQLLEEIDGFLGRFIKEDERMSLLRNNIAEVDKWLNKELPGERKPIQLIEGQLKNLGDNISISKTEFNKLKSGFTHFIMVNRL
jgi:hypothetical protein